MLTKSSLFTVLISVLALFSLESRTTWIPPISPLGHAFNMKNSHHSLHYQQLHRHKERIPSLQLEFRQFLHSDLPSIWRIHIIHYIIGSILVIGGWFRVYNLNSANLLSWSCLHINRLPIGYNIGNIITFIQSRL